MGPIVAYAFFSSNIGPRDIKYSNITTENIFSQTQQNDSGSTMFLRSLFVGKKTLLGSGPSLTRSVTLFCL